MTPSSRALPSRRLLLGTLPLLGLALAACTDNPSAASPASDGSGAGTNAIAVTLTDDACELSAATVPTGQVTFTITNNGTVPNEFEVLAEDKLRIISRNENLGPGSSVELTTSLAEGSYFAASKPNMVGALVGTAALWPMSSEETKSNASREDFNPVLDEVVITIAQLCGLGGIILLQLVGGAQAGNWEAAIALLGVFMSWAGLQILYSARYAYMYFGDGTPGGIDFNSDRVPNYKDFLYFGYAVGMTFGVTDTSVSDTQIRAVVLRHSLLSYVFNAVILATAINLVVGVFSN